MAAGTEGLAAALLGCASRQVCCQALRSNQRVPRLTEVKHLPLHKARMWCTLRQRGSADPGVALNVRNHFTAGQDGGRPQQHKGIVC